MSDLPHNLNAEKSVLGAMMIQQYAALVACDRLTADEFFAPENRVVFEAMDKLVKNDDPVDFVTLTNALEREGKIDAAGGYPYINEISTFVPFVSNLPQYIDIVKETSGQRKAYELGRKIALRAKAGELSVNDIFSEASTEFEKIIDGADDDCKIVSGKELMDKATVWMESGSTDRVKTGWVQLDSVCPIDKGNLVIIAGRPGMGKSVLAEEIGLFTANLGQRVLFVSLEMPERETANRVIAKTACVPLMLIRNGRIAGDDVGAIDEAKDHISNIPWSVLDKPGITPHRLKLKLKRMRENERPSLVIVDYLQIMNHGKDLKGDNRQETISNMTRFFKLMARELNLVVVLVSQLHRGNELRKNKRPILSDLRESGAIEQDADIVMFIHREGYYAEDGDFKSEGDEAELIIQKNRNGPAPMFIKLNWHPQTTSLREKKTQEKK